MAHIWIVWHKTETPCPWLTTIIKSLEIRQSLGHVTFETHRLCNMVMAIADGKPELYVHGKEVKGEDLPQTAYVFIPTDNESFSNHLYPAVLHLETLGVRCVNSFTGFTNTSSKYSQMCLLANQGIPMPDTFTTPCVIQESVPSILKVPEIIQFPSIVKHVSGMQGKRVMLVQNEAVAKDLSGSLFDDNMYIMQQYLSESHGSHVRAYVINDRVMGIFQYTNKSNLRVQSNLHQGGVRKEVTRSAEFTQLALKITKILQLDIAGLDFLEDQHGHPFFIEANSCAGIRNDERLANAVIDYLLSCCSNHQEN